jgi:hypothetical protein
MPLGVLPEALRGVPWWRPKRWPRWCGRRRACSPSPLGALERQPEPVLQAHGRRTHIVAALFVAPFHQHHEIDHIAALMAVAKAHEVVLCAGHMELVGIAPLVDGTAADQVIAFLVQLAEHAIPLKDLFHPDTCFNFFVINPRHRCFSFVTYVHHYTTLITLTYIHNVKLL